MLESRTFRLGLPDAQVQSNVMARFEGLGISETTVRRITECSNLVFYEIEERHIKDGKVNVVNSMNAYEFDDDGKIRRLDVYIQGVVEPSVPVETLLRRSGS